MDYAQLIVFAVAGTITGAVVLLSYVLSTEMTVLVTVVTVVSAFLLWVRYENAKIAAQEEKAQQAMAANKANGVKDFAEFYEGKTPAETMALFDKADKET